MQEIKCKGAISKLTNSTICVLHVPVVLGRPLIPKIGIYLRKATRILYELLGSIPSNFLDI